MRRSVQERRLPERYTPSDFHSNFALSIIDDDPRIVREAVDSEDGKLWKKAMDEEMTTLDNNEAWDLVELSIGSKLVASCCVCFVTCVSKTRALACLVGPARQYRG